MKVFKFGGASVKDANAVRNVSEILRLYEGEKRIVIVSAMGKTTNALEVLAKCILLKDEPGAHKIVQELETYHLNILDELFANQENPIFNDIRNTLQRLTQIHFDLQVTFDELYDRIVSFGELLSSKILTAYLTFDKHNAVWADSTRLIRTNHKFREADVDWRTTESLIMENFLPHFMHCDIQVTQGFVGHTSDDKITTLGREGSDFSAAIFAFCTSAESVTIWKDVPGMLNADPKYFDNTIKLSEISYKEAIELSYYGASVIHPKTIKPLQNKSIPLFVKSFVQPKESGTVISSNNLLDNTIPSFIFKMNQALISITPRDFSFIVEENLSDIFNRLARANAKINVMQNSALSFSILVDQEKVDIQNLFGIFENLYQVVVTTDLELVTIRHYDQQTIDRVTVDKSIILEQKTNDTVRLILQAAS